MIFILKNILSSENCKNCRICCCFEHYELWETPIVSRELRDYIRTIYPNQQFIQKGTEYLFRMNKQKDSELYFCPMLDSSKGCILGDKKPFDCRIWPYRIMRIGDRLGITIASICPVLYNKPLSVLVDELTKTGLSETIFREAKEHPDIIKDYQSGYPILIVK